MEKKKFNRGTMTGGIVRIIIALIAIAIAISVITSGIDSHDSEDRFGNVFMCLIGGFIALAAIGFICNGIKMVLDGRKSLDVARKGHAECGKIIDLSETEVTEPVNGCVSHYTVYNLKFEYSDDSGNLCESQEHISQNVYERLQQLTLVPILVYGERAIFDKKRFDKENNIG